MSAPAANARSLPVDDDAAHGLVRVELLESLDELAHQLVGERVQLLRPVQRDDRDRAVALDEDERLVSHASRGTPHRRLRLLGRHREREPVARVVDRLVPCEVPPEVQVLLRVARRLRELAREVLDDGVDLRVEFRGRYRPVDEPPLGARRGRDRLAHQHDLARASLADQQRQPLRRAARGHRAVLRADVPDERVVHHHGEVARHLQLVAAADADPVDARERRLADLAQPVVRILERAEPLPVLVRLPKVLLGPRAQVGADAERAARARQDDDTDFVVPRRVLARARELAQHLEVERVQDRSGRLNVIVARGGAFS